MGSHIETIGFQPKNQKREILTKIRLLYILDEREGWKPEKSTTKGKKRRWLLNNPDIPN